LAGLEPLVARFGPQPPLIVFRAVLKRARGDAAGAARDLESVFQREPDARVPRARFQLLRSRRELGLPVTLADAEALVAEAAYDSASHALLADRLLAEGRLAEAASAFDTALVLDPKNAWFYGSRAEVHVALGHGPQALADAYAAVLLAPDDAGARSRLGAYTFSFSEDYDLAIDMLESALAIDASLVDPYYLLGTVHLSLEDVAAARQLLERASAALPSLPPPLQVLEGRLHAADGRQAQAAELLERVLVTSRHELRPSVVKDAQRALDRLRDAGF
jgi:tetratricopeptide (TPR) repeat protein